MLRHLAGTIILILFGISCAEKRSWTEVTFEHDSYIKVPLTINGDVHWYIFDTGAGVSTILSELAVKYNLRNEREEDLAEKIEQGIKKKDSIGRFSVPAVLVPFCIGEKDFSKIDSSKVTNIFAVGELKHYGVSGKNLSGAVIGRTLINQYNWLFNFRTNKLLIADYDVDIPLSLGASCLEMRIDCGGNNMCADVLINDTMPMRFILDSGLYSQPVSVGDYKLMCDLLLPFSPEDKLKNYLYEDYYNTYPLTTSGKIPEMEEHGRISTSLDDSVFLILSSGMKFNNQHLTGVGMYKLPDYFLKEEIYNGYLTNHFIRRFGNMYIDSKNQRVVLFDSPQDSTSLLVTDLQEVVQKLKQGIYEYRTKKNNSLLQRVFRK